MERKLLAKVNPNKEYKLTKVLEDGTLQHKITGDLFNDNGEIYFDERVTVGRGFSSYWSTSGVQEVEVIGKGIRFLTYNSVYLLEEADELFENIRRSNSDSE